MLAFMNIFFQKMADGFSKMEVPDPNKIVDFIEASTAAMGSIFEVQLL